MTFSEPSYRTKPLNITKYIDHSEICNFLWRIFYDVQKGTSFDSDASFEGFKAVMFQVEVFWVVTPCNVVGGYRRFRGPCCLHFQDGILPKHCVEI
jgi:hypothetical protein